MEAVLLRDNIKSEDFYTASAVTAGEVVNVDGRAGVAVADIAAGGTGKVYIDGIFSIDAVEFIMSRGGVVGWDTNGTPYGGSTTGACETRLGTTTFLVGTVITDKVAAKTKVEVDLNAYPADLIPILAIGNFEDVAANKTLDAEDTGKVMCVNSDAKVVTLPAVGTTFRFAVMNVAGDAVSLTKISPNAADLVMGPDFAGTDNKARLNTKATSKSGDFAILEYADATGWMVVAQRGTWAEEA